MSGLDFFGAEENSSAKAKKDRARAFVLGAALGAAGISIIWWLLAREKTSKVAPSIVRYIPGPEGRILKKSPALVVARDTLKDYGSFDDIPTWQAS